jgi:hypothetical protein
MFSSFLWSNLQLFRCTIRYEGIKQNKTVLWVRTYPDSMVSLDPYQDPDSQSVSGYKRAKMTHKHRKS